MYHYNPLTGTAMLERDQEGRQPSVLECVGGPLDGRRLQEMEVPEFDHDPAFNYVIDHYTYAYWKQVGGIVYLKFVPKSELTR